MNKKYIITGITCGLLVISGFCYSCSYHSSGSSQVLTRTLSDGTNSEGQSSETNNTQKLSATDLNIEKQDTSRASIEENSITEAPQNQTLPDIEAPVYVHICGAVINPGVYQADANARICDLIEMSGGLTEDAAGDYVNQAEPVTDGERIYIPTEEEVKSLTANELIEGSPEVTKENGGILALININTANAEELMSLPSIGQAKADSIIEYRQANGNFKAIEELMNISGIKEGLFNRISSLITVN